MAKSTKHGGVSDVTLETIQTGRSPEELEAERAAIPGRQSADATTAPEPDQGPEDKPAAPSRPAHGDPKAAWVDYAVSQGADRQDAEATTKGDLIKAYGG